MVRRFLPVIYLLLLSPLVAEYLLGSMPVSLLAALPVLALMYGAGAVVVRETSIRLGRGWVPMVLLAAAYGVVEEGLVTQSLFNPDYLHLHLLQVGYIPRLGLSAVWTVYVLSLHVAWSIAIPIGLTESLFPSSRAEPWLGRVGLAIIGLLYVAGTLLVTRFTQKMEPFMAWPAQLIGAAAVAALLVVAALCWPRPATLSPVVRTRPVSLLLLGLGLGSVFGATELYGASLLHLNALAVTLLLAGCGAALLAVVARAMRLGLWGPAQEAGLAVGGMLVYVWFGFITDYKLHGSADLPGHAVLCLLMLVVAGAALIRALSSAVKAAAP